MDRRLKGVQILGRELALLHERFQAMRAKGPQSHGQRPTERRWR